MVYYVNSTIVAANAAAMSSLDPQRVDGLVFAQTPSGGEVLAAAMYLLPSSVATPPMPYGPLVQWHQRTDVCGPGSESARARSRSPAWHRARPGASSNPRPI